MLACYCSNNHEHMYSAIRGYKLFRALLVQKKFSMHMQQKRSQNIIVINLQTVDINYVKHREINFKI